MIRKNKESGKSNYEFMLDSTTTIAPIPDKPNLVLLRINIRQPNEKGMPTNQEADVLDEIENALVAAMESQFGGVYPGRVTVEGERWFHFYISTPTAGYEQTLAEVMANYPDYTFACRVAEDPEWKNYFKFLFPDPAQLQSMLNRRVVHELMKQGDQLTVPRPVAHWIYFKTQKDREAYWNVVKPKGFELVDMTTDEENSSEYPHSLWITRNDKVDYESIDECVLPLWALADEHNGNYDGWEAGLTQEA